MAQKTNMHTLSDAELGKLLEETRAALRGERFAAAGARPKESNAPWKLRRTVARILTEQGARHASAAASASSASAPTK